MKNSFPGMIKYPLSKGTYEQTNRHTELTTRIIHIATIHVLYPTVMASILMINFYIYFFTDLGVDALRLPFPFWYVYACVREWAMSSDFQRQFDKFIIRFPLDWRNPHGYLLAFTLSYVIELNVIFFLVCNICTGVGFYIFSMSLTEDVKDDFWAFGVWIKSEPNPTLLSKQLFDLIQFLSLMKR